MEIKPDDLTGTAIAALLGEHLRNMHEISPPESIHALDLTALRQPGITVWSAWEGDDLLGCGALKALSPEHGEIKSMRTTDAHRGKGVARALLNHILDEARRRGYRKVSLETGSMGEFMPAQTLYRSAGFTPCGPFAGYVEDPNSLFMSMDL